MQGSCNFSKPWWGCWPSTDGTLLLWLYLLGLSNLLTCHLGGGCGFQPSFAIDCQKWSSSMNPMGPLMAAFPWGRFCHPRGCDLNPIQLDIFQNLHISECGQGLHSTSKLQCTFHQLARLAWGQWLGFFCTMLEGLCVSQGLLRLHQPEVLVAKSHILEGQESIPVQVVGHWWHRVVVIYFWCVASCIGYLKGCPDPPGKLLDVILAENLPEFSPPGQHVKLLCMPLDPFIVPWGEGSGIEVCWRLSPTSIPTKGISSPPKNSWMLGSRGGGHLRSSSSGLVSGLDQSDGLPVPSSFPQVGRWGSSVLASFSGLSSMVTHHLDCTGLGDWSCLLFDSPWHDATWGTWVWWITVWDLHMWLPEHWQLLEHWWPQLREQFNLSILSSNSAMATNACWWPSLATAKASS